ncbi:MAG: YjbQ family protein [Methanomassiliicoccales archaeon]|nr:MAG: YjbQ family protein [Methanomassiliicoccales archaeon]
MTIKSEEVNINTRFEGDIVDITQQVQKAISKSRLSDGIACVFVPGATGAVTTIEYESGLLQDMPAALDRLFPRDITYQHQLRWHDGNGHSHVRASFIGPSITVPFKEKKLILGTWQQIVFLELDNSARRRKIIVQMLGE